MERFNHILIDVYNLYYSHEYKSPKEYKKVISSFLDEIDSARKRFGLEETSIWYLFDNHNSKDNYRHEVSEDYKSNRDDKEQAFFQWAELLKTILLSYHDNDKVVYAPALEADDLVKPVLDSIFNLDINNKVLLYSTDLDWARCINYKDRNVQWYNRKIITNKETFREKYGFYPTVNSVCLYKSIRGDSSDSIPVALHAKIVPIKIVERICGDFDDLGDLLYNSSKVDYLTQKHLLYIKKKEHELKLNWQLVSFIDINSRDFSNCVYNCKFQSNSLNFMLKKIGRFDRRIVEYDMSNGSFFRKQIIPRG